MGNHIFMQLLQNGNAQYFVALGIMPIIIVSQLQIEHKTTQQDNKLLLSPPTTRPILLFSAISAVLRRPKKKLQH